MVVFDEMSFIPMRIVKKKKGEWDTERQRKRRGERGTESEADIRC